MYALSMVEGSGVGSGECIRIKLVICNEYTFDAKIMKF